MAGQVVVNGMVVSGMPAATPVHVTASHLQLLPVLLFLLMAVIEKTNIVLPPFENDSPFS